MPRWSGFIGGSNTPQSLIANAERTCNLYVETLGHGGANAAALFPTPGFARWSQTTDVGGRALGVAGARMFGVMGGGLWEFDATGTATRRGDVAQDSNPAQIVFNGRVAGQVGIASGGNVYSFDLTTNTLTGPYIPGQCTMLAYADGFGVAFNINTGKVRLSSLNDFTTWDAANFFQRSKFPDPWQALFVDPNGLLYLIGTETFEVWNNTGIGSQPWAPLSGLVGAVGIAAPFAWSVSESGMAWLGRSQRGGLKVVSTSGSSLPQAVSSYAVNTAIEGYRRAGNISDAEMLVYHDQGHTFANVSFPTAAKTWSYDLEAQGWAERGQWNSAIGDYGIWAPRVHCDFGGKHLVADRVTGTIWEMSGAYSTDVDQTGIRRLRRSPALLGEHKRATISQIELIMDVGIATATGAGADPQAMLRLSVDGGRTWGNERRAGGGRIGEYRRRVAWTQLGIADDAVIEVTWSDPVPMRVVDALVNNLEQVA